MNREKCCSQRVVPGPDSPRLTLLECGVLGARIRRSAMVAALMHLSQRNGHTLEMRAASEAPRSTTGG